MWRGVWIRFCRLRDARSEGDLDSGTDDADRDGLKSAVGVVEAGALRQGEPPSMHRAGEGAIFDSGIAERGTAMRAGSVEGNHRIAIAEQGDFPSVVEDPETG